MWLAQRWRRAGSQKTGQREAGRLEMPRFGGRGSEYNHRNLREKCLHTTHPWNQNAKEEKLFDKNAYNGNHLTSYKIHRDNNGVKQHDK